MYKVVIDSNIWVSFLIGKKFRNLVQYIRSGRITIITCDEQLQELADTFIKPKLQKYIQPSQTKFFFSFLKGVSLIIQNLRVTPLCRDPKDDYLLALSIASNAHYLVTGDFDLLEMEKINNTLIIKYVDFETILNGQL